MTRSLLLMIQAYGTGRWLLVVYYASKKSAFEIRY